MVRKIKHTIDIDEKKINLYGISTDFSDYQLSWKLNNSCKIQLRAGKIIEKDSAGISNVFSSYYYENEAEGSFYKLISNRYESGILLPKIKTIDYFIVTSGLSETEAQKFASTARQVGGISAFISIDFSMFNTYQKKILLRI